MGFLQKLFGGKEKNDSTALVKNNIDSLSERMFSVHKDLADLLWIGDGPKRNYIPVRKNEILEYAGFKITFSFHSSDEPSVIWTNLPVVGNVNKAHVDRPPYYPNYSGLTAAQKGVYWQFLANPYSGDFDIGYVFVLYYGLERHLLEGDIEKAFNVILKLRDVYDNSSFQNYSATALVLTCLLKQRPDLVKKFYESLDNDYEYNFSSNLYLLYKYSFSLPLTAKEIMRMAKTFEFSNQNYIKKYPDIFEKVLFEKMLESFGSEGIFVNKFITGTEYRSLRKEKIPPFANISIRDQAVDVPMLSDSFKLKKAVYDLLQSAHEETKKVLAQMRKKGELVESKSGKASQPPKEIVYDAETEKQLLGEYDKSRNAVDKHFSLIALQDFYYKYRNIDRIYLEKCIAYCWEDIEHLSLLQSDYVEEETKRIKSYAGIYSRDEIFKMIQNIGKFTGNIPAFKRLAIIYEKDKKYDEAISVCDKAISYYSYTESDNLVLDFSDRRDKMISKLNSIK